MRFHEFTILPMLFVMAFTAGCTMGVTMEEQQKPPGEFGSSSGEFTSHLATQDGRDMGGFSQRPGLSIHWSGSDPDDETVRPVDVIRSTIDRMQAEQKTDLGSDKNARAMVLMIEAFNVLQGSDQIIDGVPVIR